MDLRQLNALLAVADNGSFSAAARALHTVQSNVSTHVARLERELGAQLVDRAGGTLTPEGDVVAARARRIAGELDAMAADVASLHDQVAGSVRLGVIGTTARWLVPPLFEAVAVDHPKIRLVVVDATTTSLLPQLERDQLDLAVVNLPVPDPEIAADLLFEEDHVLVAPSGHPLADRAALTLTDLDGVPLLLEPEGTNFRDHLDAEAAAAGARLEPQAEVDGMRLVATLAFRGFGAAILPASAAPAWIGGDWIAIPVEGLDRRQVGLARRKRGMLSAPARATRDVLREVVRRCAPEESGIYPAADGTDAT